MIFPAEILTSEAREKTVSIDRIWSLEAHATDLLSKIFSGDSLSVSIPCSSLESRSTLLDVITRGEMDIA